MSLKSEELRRRHQRFVYQAFSVARAADRLLIRFRFKLEPDIIFSPELAIESIGRSRIDSISRSALDRLAFHLGLIEMLSYWKAACPGEVVIEAGTLDDRQVQWWKNLWIRGMGEFFYVNQIDFRDPAYLRIVAPAPAEQIAEPLGAYKSARRSLVMVSGGKDSALTLHELRRIGEEFDCLLLNPQSSAIAVAAVAGATSPIIVRRRLDPHLLELNRRGYLNGHTPFSALLAILGLTCAALFDFDRVIVSNERSSDEGNLEYLGVEINHQYSKTFAFETAIRKYAATYLTPNINYFSFLRPLFEIQVCRSFASCPEYFAAFRSCNREQRQGTWCGRCPKCLSVFVSLAPFVSSARLTEIFGQDLFQHADSVGLLRSLLGIEGAKPFECVGTRRETLAGLFLSLKRRKAEAGMLPPLLDLVERELLPATGMAYQELVRLSDYILGEWSDQHYLPPEFAASLRRGPVYSDEVV